MQLEIIILSKLSESERAIACFVSFVGPVCHRYILPDTYSTGMKVKKYYLGDQRGLVGRGSGLWGAGKIRSSVEGKEQRLWRRVNSMNVTSLGELL